MVLNICRRSRSVPAHLHRPHRFPYTVNIVLANTALPFSTSRVTLREALGPRGPAPIQELMDLGYSSHDIITTVFRVVRNADMPEFLKLEYLKVTRRFGEAGTYLYRNRHCKQWCGFNRLYAVSWSGGTRA
jgi:hypothetical protein